MEQRVRRLSLVSFGGLVLLSAGLAGLIHRVSPRRDPSFEVNSGNAGTLVPWLQWVPETLWLWTSLALAALLAMSLTWVLRQWSQAPERPSHRARWIAIAAVLFLALGFTGYMLALSSSAYSHESIGPIKLAAAITLPALLTVHFTGMIWFWQQIKTALAQNSEPAPALQRWGQLYTSVYWAGFAASLFTALQILFLSYLFAQHMVD